MTISAVLDFFSNIVSEMIMIIITLLLLCLEHNFIALNIYRYT